MRLRPRPARILGAAVLVLVLLGLGCEKKDAPLAPDAPPIESPDDLMAALAKSYRERDLDRFASLLAHDTQAGVSYAFVLDEPTGDGTTRWGYDEEVRIHRRMFDPENLPAGEPALPGELHLVGISPAFGLPAAWTERTDRYRSPDNPDGLDPARWRAWGATLRDDVFLETVGEIDFRIEAQGTFVVVEDLGGSPGTPGRFLLLEWRDVCCTVPRAPGAAECRCWGDVKQLYR